MKSSPYLVWVLPLSSIRTIVQYRQEYNTKSEKITHVFVLCYMQCHMYTSVQITTAEQNTVYWNWIDTCL